MAGDVTQTRGLDRKKIVITLGMTIDNIDVLSQNHSCISRLREKTGEGDASNNSRKGKYEFRSTIQVESVHYSNMP